MKYLIIDTLHKDWEFWSDDLDEIMRIFNTLDQTYHRYVVVEVLAGST